MPLLKIQTNTGLSAEQSRALLSRGTDLIVEKMGKPREYVQVVVQPDQAIAFGGSTEPSAFVELRSLGMPEETAKTLSAEICGIMEQEASIPAARVFINFFDIPRPMWGWNGKTFG